MIAIAITSAGRLCPAPVEDPRREREQDIDPAHQRRVQPAAFERSDDPNQAAEQVGQRRGHEREQEYRPASGEHPAEDVPADEVCSQGSGAAWRTEWRPDR
jgi:hypothetical protein